MMYTNAMQRTHVPLPFDVAGVANRYAPTIHGETERACVTTWPSFFTAELIGSVDHVWSQRIITDLRRLLRDPLAQLLQPTESEGAGF